MIATLFSGKSPQLLVLVLLRCIRLRRLVMRATGVFPLSQSQQASRFSSCTLRPLDFLDDFGCVSNGAPDFSFGAPDEDELSIAALEGGFCPPKLKSRLDSHPRVQYLSLSLMQSWQ